MYFYQVGARRAMACALIACGFAPVANAADATDSAGAPLAAAANDAAAAEIVVTARKIRERLQDVPVAITAIGGDQLRQNNHIRLEDLNQLAPSTVVVITNGHQASVSIRGLGNNPGGDGLENSAGVFVDGVYLGRPGMAATDLIDIQQIEQLRGPQGTLFGKNTTAGALNITTAPPSFDFGVRAAATYGNYNYQQYQASVTGPISDTLAARVTGYSTTRGGVIDNITTGQKTSTIGREGARLQLLYKPNDDLSIRLIGEYAREQQSSGAVTVVPSQGVSFALIQAKLTATGARLAIDPRGLTTAADGPVETGTRQAAGSAEINWKLRGGFTLTSITAFRYWQYRSRSDTEGSSADVAFAGYYIHDYQTTQEVRLAFPHTSNFDAIAGFYFFDQSIHTDQHSDYGVDAAAWLSGIPNSLLPTFANTSPALTTLIAYNDSKWDIIADPKTRSYAGFGQGTWHVTPQWNITGGIRVTRETKHEEVYRPVPVSRITGAPVAALASQARGPFFVAIANTAPSFLISTDYHVTPGLMGYALVSRGEKAGGVSTSLLPTGFGIDALKVAPEVATNFEIGLKTDVWAHRLILNVDVFRTNVRNYQANVPEALGNQVVSLLTNAGRARTQGVEAEATLRPLRTLTLHGFAAYNDAKYLSYISGPCPFEVVGQSICNLSGRPISGAPKYTAGINGTYEQPVTRQIVAYFSLEYSWRSHYFGAQDDSIYSLTGNYGLLNLRLGVRAENQRWDVSLWGRNVGNKHYATNYFNYGALLPGAYVAFFGDPATYGGTVRVDF